MANQFSTGAVHVFIASPYYNAGSPLYFGTTESMPDDRRQPEYEMLMNDLSGSKVPLDMAWEGESAQISLVMTRWTESVAQGLETKPIPGVSVSGQWTWNDMGALAAYEGNYLRLWLVYTFGAALANKAAYVQGGAGLRAGRYYPQCVVWAPETEETGTKPMKRHFLFFAWPAIDVQNRRFLLYSTDPAAF